MGKDLRTADLPILNLAEDIEKRIAQMELSNLEKAKFKKIIEYNYLEISELLNLKKSVSIQYHNFLDLGLKHYRLRKNIGNVGSTTFSELENNNWQLRRTFLGIRNTIARFDELRFCLNS